MMEGRFGDRRAACFGGLERDDQVEFLAGDAALPSRDDTRGRIAGGCPNTSFVGMSREVLRASTSVRGDPSAAGKLAR
jgi:hypothetical protein